MRKQPVMFVLLQYLFAGCAWIFLLLFLNLLLEFPFHYVFLLWIGLSVSYWLGIYLFNLYRLRWLRRLHLACKRLQPDNINDFIVEIGEQWAKGDRSPENAIILASAYSCQGNGKEAEKFANEALAALEKRGTTRKYDRISRLFCELADITLFGALELQGRFKEAALYMQQRIPYAVRPYYLTILIAWGFFLDHDDDNARTLLLQVKSPSKRYGIWKEQYPRYELILAYLRYKLLGTDIRPELNQFRDQYAEWQKEAARHAANPYGVRLKEIVDEMGELLAVTT